MSQRRLGFVLWLCTALLAFALVFLVFVRQAYAEGQENSCAITARAALNACQNAARDDYWTAIGDCANGFSAGARNSCLKDAEALLRAVLELCGDQLLARTELCSDLGEARYDPDWDPANFVDPLDIGDGVTANPLFPLEQGRQWVYRSGDERETTTVTVTPATKRIGGVTCLVTRDFTPIEPDTLEHKYYAPGIGLVLELDPETGERTELVSMTPSVPNPKFASSNFGFKGTLTV